MKRRYNKFSKGVLLIGVAISFIAFMLSREFDRFTPDFRISAAKLHYVYATDEENADEIFLNKRICVIGELSGIEINQNGDTVLTLNTNENNLVRCVMSAEHGVQAHDLSLGMKIEVRGLCAGFTTEVVMLDCSLT